MLTFISIFFVTSAVLVILHVVFDELIKRKVLGSFIEEKDLDEFFKAHIHLYVSGPISKKMLHGAGPMPYLSCSLSSFFSKWYMSEVGRIPLWSKWTKELDSIYKEREKELKKDIVDFIKIKVKEEV